MKNKLKVEIWSDIMCPFCYIGKRKFEMALEKFSHKDEIEIVWASYQLTPHLMTQPNKNIHTFLSETKGISLEEAKEMNNHVTQMANEIGLHYDFDRCIVANTFNAHRFVHFAQSQNKSNEAEERLFAAYFSEGKNIDDFSTLLQLGLEIGLDSEALKRVLESKEFAEEVQLDIQEARQIGIRSVPFFVFDRKTAVSGAQDPQIFLETLEHVFEGWKKNNADNKREIIQGQSCISEGACE